MTTKAKKKASPAVEAAPVTPIQGYRRAPRYEEIDYRPDDLPAGAKPLKVKIRTNLSFDEIDAIPFGLKVKFGDVWPTIVDYVVEWNLMGENAETGEMEPVPPPATAGVEVFKCLSDDEALWLILAIKFKHRQKVESDEAKPASTPSDSGPETSDASRSA